MAKKLDKDKRSSIGESISWIAASCQNDLSGHSPLDASELSNRHRGKSPIWQDRGSSEALVSPRFPEEHNPRSSADSEITVHELSKKLYKAFQVIDQQEEIIQKLRTERRRSTSHVTAKDLERRAEALEDEKQQLVLQNKQLLHKLQRIEESLGQYEHYAEEATRMSEKLKLKEREVHALKKENHRLLLFVNKLKQELAKKEGKGSFEGHFQHALYESTPIQTERHGRTSRTPGDRPKSSARERGSSRQRLLDKLVDLLEVSKPSLVLDNIKNLLRQTKNAQTEHKFIVKVTQLVEQCMPTGTPSLNTTWKWIRRVVEEYSNMKKGAPGVITKLKGMLNTESIQQVPAAVEQLVEQNQGFLEVLARVKHIFGLPEVYSVQETNYYLNKELRKGLK